MTPDAADRGAPDGEPARPRRRRLPDGPQGVADRPQSAEAEVPGRQRRRVGAGRVQGPRGDGARAAPADRGLPDRRARDRVRRTSSSTSAASTWPSTRSSQAAVDEARAAGLFGDVEITVHRGAGAYICGEETALLDSLEGRRGQPRPRPPFPPVQGLYNAPTQINNVCTIATRPDDHRDGRGGVREDRRRRARPGTAIFSISGNVVRPGNYELELGTPMRELIYDLAGGIPDGRELKAVIPGGSSVPALSPDQIDVPLDYDSLGAARHVLRRRVADRRRRPLLHGAARAALDEVLHARVVRQVHAVPRGDALDGADPREDRGRRRRARRPRPARRRSARASSASRCARSATSPCTRSRATSRSGATSSSRTSSRALPVRRRVVARRDRRAERRARTTRARGDRVSRRLVTLTIDDARSRCRRAPASSRRRSRPGSRSPSSATSRGSGRRSAPAACASCEVAPGPPKPQAACTLTAADGMVVQDRAAPRRWRAEAQNATLEFILVNHPLDCPVCDKGGECPLQDLTFRYGPGQHAHDLPEAHVREADPDLAADRARPRALHPLLPLHPLLRGRRRGRAARRASTAARSR